jgi:dUTP pyrophosphatase
MKVAILPDLDVILPEYAKPGDSGMDLRAYFPDRMPRVLAPGDRMLVPTGIRVAIPEGSEIQIRPRSGTALKQGLTVLNAPGSVDSSYRGTLGVILINTGKEPILIEHGERIAQAVLCPVLKIEWEIVTELPESQRGESGFGSTGV